jgi:putative ABC transport system permease protein
MLDDLKAAIRSLISASSRAFTAVALIVLTLGIGATTAIFSVVDAVVLRALPFDEHDRLVAVGERRVDQRAPDLARDPLQLSSAAPQNYLDWAAQQQVFEAIAAIAGGAITYLPPGAEPEDLRSQRVTAGFFDVLRSHPAIGRAFTAANEVAGRDRVVVLSDQLWRRRFNADPAVVGRSIPLNGNAYEVVGIMPAAFAYPVGLLRPTDLWIPYVVPENERVRDPHSISIYLQTIARLKPGVSIQQAQAQMDQISAAIRAANPEWNKGSVAGVRSLIDHLLGARTKSWLLLLLGAVGLVLLIACANVANLLLARATAREREIGIRAALGAGRWRLIRQLLIESVTLSAVATCCSVVLAWWAIGLLKNAMPEGVPRVAGIALDLRVLGAAAGLSLLTGMLFGIVPALRLSRPDLTQALKDGGRGSVGAGRQRLRSALVVAEIAIAVVLLVGAALFIGSFVALLRIDPGFDPANVLTMQVTPRFEPGKPGADVTHVYQRIIERLRKTPEVTQAAVIAGGMPLSGAMMTTTLDVPGQTLPNNDVSIRIVSADYHRALRIPLRAGRYFEDSDRKAGVPVVVINESAVKKFFPAGDALGRQVKVNDDQLRTIVGIVGDVHQVSLEAEVRPESYVPALQSEVRGGDLLVRTSGDPYRVLAQVKTALHAEMPDVPLRGVRTMEELIARRTAQRRLNMMLLGLFGLLGLVIAAVGIYGVMAYVVSQRTREIGVRMALGATRGNVIGMVMRNATLMVALGLAIGGAGAWYLSAAAGTFLFRLEATDPRAFAAAVVTLAAAALAASAIPARRAASVDPITALRE